MNQRLVDLSFGRRWARPVARVAERILALDKVEALYGRLQGRDLPLGEFSAEALRLLGVELRVSDADRARLRAVQGPCLVLANHPLGGRDALALNVFLSQSDREFRVMANRLLGLVPEVRPSLIMVDPFGGKRAAAYNLQPMRQASAWLKGGGLLGLFPAGEVSLWQGPEGRVADKAWSGQAVRLAQAAGATVLPLHISARCSGWLQALARIHPALKTPFLARELMTGPARELVLSLGKPMPASALPHPQDPGAAAAWLRRQVYSLDPATAF
jgi:putative hemolysin